MLSIDKLFEEGYTKDQIIAMVNAASTKREMNTKRINETHNALVKAATEYFTTIGMFKNADEKEAFSDLVNDILVKTEENLTELKAAWENTENFFATKKETLPKSKNIKVKNKLSDDEALDAFLASLL